MTDWGYIWKQKTSFILSIFNFWNSALCLEKNTIIALYRSRIGNRLSTDLNSSPSCLRSYLPGLHTLAVRLLALLKTLKQLHVEIKLEAAQRWCAPSQGEENSSTIWIRVRNHSIVTKHTSKRQAEFSMHSLELISHPLHGKLNWEVQLTTVECVFPKQNHLTTYVISTKNSNSKELNCAFILIYSRCQLIRYQHVYLPYEEIPTEELVVQIFSSQRFSITAVTAFPIPTIPANLITLRICLLRQHLSKLVYLANKTWSLQNNSNKDFSEGTRTCCRHWKPSLSWCHGFPEWHD